MTQLILASSSVGRKGLLEKLKIPFSIVPSSIDEEKIIGKAPLETLRLRALAKGEDVTRILTVNSLSTKRYQKSAKPIPLDPNIIILSADSGIILDGQLIGKPKSRIDATQILKKLSGKTHEFVTAVYMIKRLSNKSKGLEVIQDDHQKSLVTFRELTAEDINFYLDRSDYKRFAGGYALSSIQTFITKIEGSVSNVIGLPLEIVIPVLKANQIL